MLKPPIVTVNGFLTPLKCQASNVLEFTAHKLDSVIPQVEEYYDVNISEVIEPYFGAILTSPVCDNSTYSNGQWQRKNKYDFTGYIPLTSYNNTTPFDPTTDVYGGELMFKTLKFKHPPYLGQLIVFPSAPNFLHFHNTIKIGALQYIKFHLICDEPYVHDYRKFNNICSQW